MTSRPEIRVNPNNQDIYLSLTFEKKLQILLSHQT